MSLSDAALFDYTNIDGYRTFSELFRSIIFALIGKSPWGIFKVCKPFKLFFHLIFIVFFFFYKIFIKLMHVFIGINRLFFKFVFRIFFVVHRCILRVFSTCIKILILVIGKAT